MTEKKCSKCKEVKPISEFNRDKSSKSGYRYSCRICEYKFKPKYIYNAKYKESKRKYYQNNKENILKRARHKRLLDKIKNFHKTFERKLAQIKRQRFRKNHPEYDRLRKNVWGNMKDRCRNPNNKWYYCYGGKGVKVCEEWNNFEVFYEWSITHGYGEGLTIDRIDNDGDYCPENCRYVTMRVNNRNRGCVKLNKKKVSRIKRSLINNIPIKVLAHEYNVSNSTIYSISRNKRWSDVEPANSI